MILAQTFNCTYENENMLDDFIIEHELQEYPAIMIQVYTGKSSLGDILELQQVLCRRLPHAAIIGCSSDGEIVNGEVVKGKTSIHFTVFEQTHIKSILLKSENYRNSAKLGKSLIDALCDTDTKAILLFPTASGIDAHSLLSSIQLERDDVTVIGGMAAEIDETKESFVWNEEEITNAGAVAIVLNNIDLSVQTFINYKWKEIGQTLTVTKSNENIIYSINHKKPLQIFAKYLGQDFLKDLPHSGVEFPFITEKNGKKTAYFVNKINSNGSIEISGKVRDGDFLTFGYLNIPEIIRTSLDDLKKMSKKRVEAIFVYNCTARRNTLSHFTEKETEMLQSIAPTNGFFSNGQFCSEKDKPLQLFGYSTSVIGISESKAIPAGERPKFTYDIPKETKSTITMSHLIEASSKEIRALNENIHLSEQKYKSLFDNNTDIVFSTNLQGYFTSINPAFGATFDYEESDLLGKSALKYISPNDYARIKMHFYRSIKGKIQYYNMNLPTKSGKILYFQMKNIPIIVNGEIVGIYVIAKDTTEQKKVEERMMQLAYYDEATELPNRAKFMEHMNEQIFRANKKQRRLAVMFIDIDRFKIINDSLGHYTGDIILKELADRIKEIAPLGVYLGRFAGDKFTLIITKNPGIEESLKIANSIKANISRPLFYENQEFYITGSFGLSLYPNDGKDAQTLLKNADTAMNRSKSQGGDRITFYSAEMNDQAIQRLELESNLRRAINKQEFYLCYQPLIDLDTNHIYGSEALIRWKHPTLGLVPPGDFIPLAEETGLIDEIGTWVLRTACKQNKKWHDAGMGDFIISVNVSVYQFQQGKFIDHVKAALEDADLEPQFLHLELTESLMLRNVNYSISVMKELRDLGVKVSIDDFGTGYSSLSYLKYLPIDSLKIDRSFINNLEEASDIAIVKAIITMGHGLDVKVVAEGVETQEQIELLKDMKCHYAQGYYIHRPLSIEEFERDVKRRMSMFNA